MLTFNFDTACTVSGRSLGLSGCRSAWLGQQAANQVVGKSIGDFAGAQSAVRAEPKHAPVQSAQDCAGRESRVTRDEFTGTNAGGDELPQTFFITVAFVEDAVLQSARQRGGQEVRRGSLDFIEHAGQVRHDHGMKFFRGSDAQAADFPQRCEQAVQGAVLTEEKDFVLAAKIVIEVGRGEVRGGGDVAHAGFKKAARAKLAAGRAENLKSAREMPPAKAAVAVERGSARQRRSSRITCAST